MPTYEYKCRKCQHEFEEFQSISAEPVKICPECKGQVERIISGGVGLIFKGSGFYITDSKEPAKRDQLKKAKQNLIPRKRLKKALPLLPLRPLPHLQKSLQIVLHQKAKLKTDFR